MIDIIVPTYNRPKDIEKFIVEIKKQDFNEYHVIIVDDCGDLPIEHLIPKNDANFTYIRLEKNQGQAAARNRAIETGKGEIIISLDDDAWFENGAELGELASYFQLFPSLGCLMFDVRTPQDDYLSVIHSIKTDGQLIGSHITCGCAYTRKALESINGFGGYLHSGAEETDVTLKLIAKDYELRLAKNIKVFHNYTPGVRSKKWYRMLRFNTTRNDMLIVLMRYPARYVLPYFFGKYFSHILFSFKNRRDSTVAGLYTIWALPMTFVLLITAIRNRAPLSKDIFLNWLKIRW